jgi:hypothetical protein
MRLHFLATHQNAESPLPSIRHLRGKVDWQIVIVEDNRFVFPLLNASALAYLSLPCVLVCPLVRCPRALARTSSTHLSTAQMVRLKLLSGFSSCTETIGNTPPLRCVRCKP